MNGTNFNSPAKLHAERLSHLLVQQPTLRAHHK